VCTSGMCLCQVACYDSSSSSNYCCMEGQECAYPAGCQ
jgi:hypothetical protein